MKHKLQNLLKHKLQWFLLLAALFGVSQGVWGYKSGCYITGEWDSWNYWHSLSSTGDEVTINLEASHTYRFNAKRKYDDDSGHHDFGCGGCSKTGSGDVTLYHAENNNYTNLTTTVAGNYKFKLKGWDNNNPIITVTFPSASTDTYDVAGNGTSSNGWCCGANWSASGCAMTGNSSSYPVYKTFSNVPVNADLQFKVTKNDSWDTSYGYSNYSSSKSTLSSHTTVSESGGNIKIQITTNPHDITIYYDGSNVYIKTEEISSCTTPTDNDITISAPANSTTLYLGTGSAPSVTQTITATCSKGNTYLWSATPTSMSYTGYWGAGTAIRAEITSSSFKSTTATFYHEGVYTATFAAGCSNTTDASKNAPTITVKPGYMYFGGTLFDNSWSFLDSRRVAINTSTNEFVYEWTAAYTSGEFLASVGNTCGSLESSAYTISNYAEITTTGVTKASSGNHNFSPNIGTINVGDRLKLTVTYNGVNASNKPQYEVKLEKVCSNPTAQTVSGTATICDGSSTNVTVSSSQSNYTYKLYKGGSATATTKAGTGSALNFSVSEAGTYTVHAYYTSGSDAYCKADMTGSATVTVDATSVAGSITADASSVCNGNGTKLTLGGKTGNVTKWQMSTTSSSSGFSDVTNTDTSLSTGSLTQNTWYRAVVTNGVCSAATSTAVGVTVVARPSVTTQPASTVVACSGAVPTPNSISVVASGTDLSYQWQSSSTSDEGPWNDLSKGTTDTFTFGAATTGGGTYYYRCKITSATCSDDPIYTTVSTLTVVPNPTAGTISGSAEACSGVSGDVSLTLSGHTSSGTGIQWQKSTDSGSNWSNISGATSTSLSTSQTVATQYRAVVTTTVASCSRNTDAYSVAMKAPMALTSITLTPNTICTGGESTVTANGLVLSGGSVAYTSSATSKANVAKVSDSEATVSGVAVGNATIIATLSGGCGSTVTKTADISVSEGPDKFTLTAAGGTTICSAGGKLRLSGSESGFSYQLYKNGSAYRSPVEGTGSALEFDVFESGDYVCRAYLTSSPSCYTIMTGEVTLHISLTPTLIPATPTVTSYTPVTITSINTDILTWEISGEGNTAYLYDKTSNTVKVKASAAGSPYTITATTAGGCSQTATLTVNADVEVCN